MLKDEIMGLLTELGGNVPVVADRLNIDPSYVHRLKKQHWLPAQKQKATPGEPEPSAIEVPPNGKAITVPTKADIINSLAPNLTAVQELRDDTISKLRGMIEKDKITADALSRLLSILLKYENTINELARPTLNVFDQRQQAQFNIFGGLVDQLGELDPEQLRALAGVPTTLELGEIIDHEV